MVRIHPPRPNFLKENKMRRALKLEGIGTEFELSKVVQIDTKVDMINIEKLKDGTFRMIYSKSLIPDITQLTAITVIRED